MLTQREAAQRWSIPWTTFRRAVKAGKVSVGADKRVDPVEMLRAFGEPSARVAWAENGTNGPVGTSTAQTRIAALETEIARLRQFEIASAGLAATVAAQADNLKDLRAEVLRLGHDVPPRRRWWWSR